MDSKSVTRSSLSIGVALCWLSLAILPLGLVVIGGGPCAGPRDFTGAVCLLLLGIGGLGTAGYDVFRVIRSFNAGGVKAKMLSVVSVLCAGCVAVIGGFFFIIGLASTGLVR